MIPPKACAAKPACQSLPVGAFPARTGPDPSLAGEAAMPKAYWIAHVTVDDPAAYEAYRAWLRAHPLGQENYAFAKREQFIRREDRIFLRLASAPTTELMVLLTSPPVTVLMILPLASRSSFTPPLGA